MPVTQRIYGALRSGIRDGRLPSGSRLDEGNLGRMLSAPRDAVRAALQRLRDDHLVERAPRRGTVVMRGPSRVAARQAVCDVFAGPPALAGQPTPRRVLHRGLRSRARQCGHHGRSGRE
ncbi:GntR family transcriptional regulator [Streptomyces malaysiensis subsp. malaysiensis]|uniref:GntR family transcriptional regulator n=1 Tax=Streptomyces malaysiensis TaxID=92644 RepID=UPI000BFB9664|nr:GntR family transcriptional regulator [Streptomyces malaysiensis]